MHIEQIYTKCLAEASYLVISGKEAAVIDPIREPDAYLATLEEKGATLKYIFETHFHADFVSGHLELAEKTGAPIIYGPGAEAGYAITVATDGQVFPLGEIALVLLHTPGHTLESSCILLKKADGQDYCIFTGDTLFSGDVGRPDLAVKSDLSREDLAGLLFQSLGKKLKPLANEVIVYPGHGPGSACGKNIGKEIQTTIGKEKERNYAFKETSKEAFVKSITDGLLPPPAYFFADAAINKKGYTGLDKVMERNFRPLSVPEVQIHLAEGAVLLDTRGADQFAQGFPKGAINIGLGGQFAIWAGTLLPIEKRLVILAADAEKAKETMIRLARVGYENVAGYLEGGIATWEEQGGQVDSIACLGAKDAVPLIQNYQSLVLDVREPGELAQGKVDGCIHIRLQDLPHRAEELSLEVEYLVVCQSGYRSMVAASILKQKGFRYIKNVLGGMQALSQQPVILVSGGQEVCS